MDLAPCLSRIENWQPTTRRQCFSLAGSIILEPVDETHSNAATIRRLLVPLLEALPESEEVCCVEIPTKVTEDW